MGKGELSVISSKQIYDGLSKKALTRTSLENIEDVLEVLGPAILLVPDGYSIIRSKGGLHWAFKRGNEYPFECDRWCNRLVTLGSAIRAAWDHSKDPWA